MAPWCHAEQDGLRHPCPVHGVQSLDRDRRPRPGELLTGVGAHGLGRIGLGIGEKRAEGDPEGEGDALQQLDGRVT
jgi:hypothetical protein